MYNFVFISTFISEFFQNSGIQEFMIYLLGAFGVAFCVRVACIGLPRLFRKW